MKKHDEFRTDTADATGVHGLSLVGRRKENQDYCLAETRGRICLAIVCDGLGGSINGSLASSLAARMFHHAIFSPRDSPYDQEGEGQRELICREIAGNIQHRLSNSPDLLGSSTTLTALIISKGEHPFADIVHIGDTRCYFETSDNQYRCETDDHTIAGDLCRQGNIEYHEISKADGNNVLTRFLGDCKNTKIQFKSSKDVPNTAVLCSDGVWGVLHDENGLTIPPHDNSNMAVELVQNAIIRGSSDNCTAVVVHTGVI